MYCYVERTLSSKYIITILDTNITILDAVLDTNITILDTNITILDAVLDTNITILDIVVPYNAAFSYPGLQFFSYPHS